MEAGSNGLLRNETPAPVVKSSIDPDHSMFSIEFPSITPFFNHTFHHTFKTVQAGG